MKGPCAVNLHNAVTISQDRLGRRVAHLGSLRMSEICAVLRFSFGCDLGHPNAAIVVTNLARSGRQINN